MKYLLFTLFTCISFGCLSAEDFVQDQQAISPQQITWNQIQTAFDLYNKSQFEGAYHNFNYTYQESLKNISSQELNILNASLFGILICADKLNYMDAFYTNLGKGAVAAVIEAFKELDDEDNDPDFFDELTQSTSLSKLELEAYAKDCRSKIAQKLAFALLKDD
jgi:hypothetical protein